MAKKKTSPPDEAPDISFEESLAQLEEVVGKLESGRLPLAESLAAYEAGVRRLKQCYQLLEAAELKIAEVSRVDEQGRPQLTPYADGGPGDASDLAEKADARSRRRTAAPSRPGAPRDADDADDGALF
jgi:exodeoxyribonuclease VII small subunit